MGDKTPDGLELAELVHPSVNEEQISIRRIVESDWANKQITTALVLSGFLNQDVDGSLTTDSHAARALVVEIQNFLTTFPLDQDEIESIVEILRKTGLGEPLTAEEARTDAGRLLLGNIEQFNQLKNELRDSLGLTNQQLPARLPDIRAGIKIMAAIVLIDCITQAHPGLDLNWLEHTFTKCVLEPAINLALPEGGRSPEAVNEIRLLQQRIRDLRNAANNPFTNIARNGIISFFSGVGMSILAGACGAGIYGLIALPAGCVCTCAAARYYDYDNASIEVERLKFERGERERYHEQNPQSQQTEEDKHQKEAFTNTVAHNQPGVAPTGNIAPALPFPPLLPQVPRGQPITTINYWQRVFNAVLRRGALEINVDELLKGVNPGAEADHSQLMTTAFRSIGDHSVSAPTSRSNTPPPPEYTDGGRTMDNPRPKSPTKQ